MKRLASSALSLLTCLTVLATQAASHKDVAPLAAEAVQAVKGAQQGRPDPLAASLERHLGEGLEVADRSERDAARIGKKALKAGEVQETLAGRRAEAAAKRQELLILKEEALARLDRETETLAAQGQTAEAAQARGFKQKLVTRFNGIAQDLDDLSKADKSNLDARAKRVANRIKGWLAARPVEPLPQPNWQRVEPTAPIELPPAKIVPSFVSDAYWLMQEKVASRDGFIRVALRATPAEATACGYNESDRADTAEAPKTHPDIVALAKQLDYNPVRMFEWVNQNIKFEPYYGSMKGGLGALWSKSGGASDQASLLAALLRASNIPVRYVRGTVQVRDNAALGADGRGARWVGAKNNVAAASVLSANGNPSAGGDSTTLQLAHVWIEACLPYAAYRGTALDDSGHRWVPLDPSYKDQRYQAGVSVDSSFDFNYTSWLASRLDAGGNYKLPQEAFEDEVAIHAKTKAPNYANTTLEDVPYKSEIKRQRFDILPIVPPYEVVQYTSWSGVANESAETAALPERHKYRLLVAVKTVADSLLAQKTLDLAELASKRLTLSFKGATAGDQTAFDAWFNAVDPAAAPTCATSINMTPAIKLEGAEQTSDAGSGSTLLCSKDNKLTMTVSLAELGANATRTNVTYVNIGAANLHALHAYAWHTSDTYLAKRSEQLLTAVRANSSNPNADRDGIEGEFLNIAANKYSRYVADASKRAGELFGESGTVGVSVGLTAAQVKVNYLFDLPYGLFRKGFLIDWPGGKYTGSRLDTPSNTDKRAFKLAGFASSAYEAYIWNEVANLDAVSTTRGLQFADEQNIEILQINNTTDWNNNKCKLTNTCSNGALNINPAGTNYSTPHVNSIYTDYVSKGYKLTIPRRLIQYPDASGWLGATFYGEKFVTSGTSSASFPINGYSGGVTIDPADSTSGTTGSTDGSSSGGYPVGDPWGSLYNPSLGTGIQADPFAPTFAQQSGINGYQTALGWGTGTSASGDPVNMVTGNLIHSERDIAIKGRGGLPLVFERWYNSKSTKDGPLGYGWTHSFNHQLRFYGVESGVAKVSWTDGTGGERFFSTANHVSGNISVGAAFSGTAGVYATLERLTGGTYRLTERSGMQYVFESVNATATDTSQKSRLLSIADKNGNTLTLSYTAATGCTGASVCKVTDSLNRALTFTYNGSRISQIADWTGRQWQYTYDTNNDLATFKNPLAVAGTQPAVTYQYYGSLDGTKLAHAMKQYTLPRGNGMRFEYYANGRVFRHTPFDTAGTLKTESATTFAWTEFRREAKQIDALGNERRFLFDANGNPLSITDEAGAETSYTYDTTAGRIHLRLSKTDPQGMTTAYAYDTLGNLSDVTLPSTRTLQYRDHTAYGQPKRVKDADGNWTLNRYDAAGNLTDHIRVKTGVTPTADTKPLNTDILAWTQIQADSAGNPVKTRSLRDWTTAVLGDATTGTGPALETVWDANKLNRVSLTRRGDTDGTPASLEVETYSDFSHDSLGRTTRGPDANWYAADTQYDPLDRPIKSPDGRGHQWDTVYDPNGNPLTVGLTIGGAYLDGYYAAWDDLDRLERKVDYAGNATLTQYDPLGRVSQITEADGYTIGFDRDAIGRVTGAYNQEGHRASLSLDADGRPRSSTDPNNLTTSYEYYHASEDGRLKKTTLPTVTGQAQGKAAEIASYDGAGRPLRINALAADGTIRDSYRFYDELGRLTRSVGPQVSATDTSRPVSCYVYTALSDVKEIWAGSTTDTTSKTCDLIGDANLKKQVSRTYDDFGRELSETDQNGKVWKWTWNLHNQLVSSQTPSQIAAGQSTTYAYGTKGVTGETQGQLKQRSVPGAQTAVYTRDALGFVTKAETKNGSNSLVVAYDYAYDPAKRLRTVTDSRGNKQLSYTWTPGGRLAMVEDSDSHQASLSYDATGRLASVVAPNGETIGFTYDAGGRLVETRLNSGQRTTQSWFEDGGLKQKQNLYNATVLSSHLYTLDQQGRRSGQTETINASTKTWSYLYDNLDRITSASDGTAETYGYDIFGNRRSKTKSGTTTAYLYDDAHQLGEIRSGSDTGTLIGAAVYDADGHMVKLCEVSSGGTITQPASDCTASGTGATTLALVWNALDHLNTATRTGANAIAESYAYDDSGRRISKTSGATTTSYLYDGDAIHAEWNGSISGNPAVAYVHGSNIDEPLLRLTGTTSSPAATQAAYLQDGLGSVIGLANITGTLTANQRFDAWGVKTTSSGTIPQYGYTGREPDATGLDFYRARYYHPGLGRFASRDPMGMADSVSPYAYVQNNPVNLIDPMGLEALLSGTPMSAAYWGMLADASFYNPGTLTDVRGGGNGGTFTPGQQSLQNASGSSTLDKVQFGLDLLGLTEPFGVAADLVNAGISYGRGDALGGSLSLGAAIPVIGAAATTGKLGSKAADVLQANKAAGDAFEGKVMGQLQQSGVVQQVTVKTQSGVKTRIDLMGRDANGNIVCTECKASVTAPLTKNQAAAFPEIQQSGAIVVGKGKPGFPGGTQIPPTTVDIIRP